MRMLGCFFQEILSVDNQSLQLVSNARKEFYAFYQYNEINAMQFLLEVTDRGKRKVTDLEKF